MSLFVARLLGSADGEELRSVSSEFSAVELSKVRAMCGRVRVARDEAWR